MKKQALTGNTFHVVPIEGGQWQVVDPRQRRDVFIFRAKSGAIAHAKSVAAARPPSQVVLFDKLGKLKPIAHYQLPQYRFENRSGSSLFEAAVKSFVIAGLMAAGVAVLGDVVKRIDRELEQETSKSRRSRRRFRR
ncbi:MAG TPA: DUF2188 domain-containing protein [Bryobacteraceae bacterium]|nr:DUF2188 domain-containing protein [Bryobacteraceae bacterium]